TGLVLLAVLVDRLSLSARAIAYAALVILLLTPEAAAGPSIAFYEAMRGRIGAWHAGAGPVRRFARYLLGIAFTTVLSTLVTMTFTNYHFLKNGLFHRYIIGLIAIYERPYWPVWTIFGPERQGWGLDGSFRSSLSHG